MGRKTNGCVPFSSKGKSDREQKKLKKKRRNKKVFPVKLFFSVDASSRKISTKKIFFGVAKKRRRKEENSFIDKREEHTAQQQHTWEKLWMNFEQENPLVTQIGIFGLRFNLPDSACHKLPYFVVSILCEINP